MKWLKRIVDYHKDKMFSEKCGLEAKDICQHEGDGKNYYGIHWHEYPNFQHTKEPWFLKCIKCGEFYK